MDDFKEDYTEYQLVAAGRGLPIPAADEIPPEELIRPTSPESPHASNHNIQSLMVPISSRSQSAASDASTTLSPSHPAFSSSSPPASPMYTSPFRPRSKTLASLTTSSKNPSSNDMVPREIQLAKDPYINGQALEVFLYKDAIECPICFLYYPPYLNKTRCCDQAICSECFVQIKRPDPHPPEHHADPSNPAPPTPESIDPEALVSEPAMCPYCQQPEFGVTYEPPAYRRGLSYANPHALGNFTSAMSSSSSINSTSSPILAPQVHKRRTVSVSANASTVITTDRVRPDWATKLANARSHLARRSAAATALHTAAYLIGNGAAPESRGFGFSSRGRFSRHRGESSPASGSATPSPLGNEQPARNVSDQLAHIRRENQENGSRRRSRMDDLEEIMVAEAIRQSLVAEEERKKKAEKEAAKDSKKKAKEEKKKEKRERKVYGSGNSSASGSALSLSLPGIGLSRRRGNSGGSNLIREITPENTEPTTSKGKEVDRSHITSAPSGSAPIDFSKPGSSRASGFPGARWLDNDLLMHNPDSPTAPDRPSHLRTMSNASSPASSFAESVHGSMRNESHAQGSSSSLETPNASGSNLDGQSSNAGEGGDANGGAGPDSMFNFQSLAARIGDDDDDDKADAARHIEHLNGGAGEGSGTNSQDEIPVGIEESIATLKADDSHGSADSSQEAAVRRQTTLLQSNDSNPEVMITPVTPAATNHDDDDSKQLGAGWTEQVTREILQ